MNEIEQECIILNSVWEMIDGMVNWAMFVKHEAYSASFVTCTYGTIRHYTPRPLTPDKFDNSFTALDSADNCR
jgi:hypothetical protein